MCTVGAFLSRLFIGHGIPSGSGASGRLCGYLRVAQGPLLLYRSLHRPAYMTPSAIPHYAQIYPIDGLSVIALEGGDCHLFNPLDEASGENP